MTETKTYTIEELFEDIPGDPDHCILNIPPEICKSLGWNEGDKIKITVKENQLSLIKL